MDHPLDVNCESIPYQPLFNNGPSYANAERDRLLSAEEHEMPPVENFVTMPRKEARWSHIFDLDDFFRRIYEYFQKHGFFSMVLQDVFKVIFLWYVVVFPLFVTVAIDYDVLFQEGYNHSVKVSLADAILPWDEVQKSFDGKLITVLVMTSLYLVFRSQQAFFNIFKYWEIRSFFCDGLKIRTNDLPDKTWREVQSRLIELQSQIQMCLHKKDINELDVCHRILRFKNYMIGLVDKNVLPVKFQVPVMGECVFFTSALKFNYEMILFRFPGAPFKSSWHLRSKYKQFHKKKEAASELSRRILLFGLANLILIPFILIWTILYFFFENFALFRNDPSLLGSRTWSLYGKYYLRHYNELDHDFHTRLNKGYRASAKYMNLFWSPALDTIAKFLMSICSGFLLFLLCCTVKDEDTLAVQGMIGIITVLGIVVACAKNLIPDENMVKMPESLMTTLLCHIHYAPEGWRGQAHTLRVQREFSQLFQYKLVYLFNEILSAVVTPFILLFWLRPRSMMIVNFLKNNTISLDGLGDVCVFAHMDLRKTGFYNTSMRNRRLYLPYPDEPPLNSRAAEDCGGVGSEMKKMELSLLQFTLANPEWRVPDAEVEVLSTIRQNVNAMKKDIGPLNMGTLDHPLYTSSQALSMIGQTCYDFTQYNSLTLSALPKSQFNMSGLSQKSDYETPSCTIGKSLGAENLPASSTGAEATTSSSSSSVPPESVRTWKTQPSSQTPNASALVLDLEQSKGHRSIINEAAIEMTANEMSYSALYFYGHHRIRKLSDGAAAPTEELVRPVDPRETDAQMTRYFRMRELELSPQEAPREPLRLSNIEEEEELVRQIDPRSFDV